MSQELLPYQKKLLDLAKKNDVKVVPRLESTKFNPYRIIPLVQKAVIVLMTTDQPVVFCCNKKRTADFIRELLKRCEVDWNRISFQVAEENEGAL